MEAEKATSSAYGKAKSEASLVMEQVFQLYSNLIVEKARQAGTKTLAE